MNQLSARAALAAVLLSLVVPSASLGQPSSAQVPLLVIKSTYPQVRVQGEPAWQHTIKPLAFLRRTAPVGDIRDWLPMSDPAIAALNGSAMDGAVSMDIEVAPDGAVVGCEARASFGKLPSLSGFCERITARAKMIPAVDPDGVNVADFYRYIVYFGRGFEEPRWLRLPPLPLVPPAS